MAKLLCNLLSKNKITPLELTSNTPELRAKLLEISQFNQVSWLSDCTENMEATIAELLWKFISVNKAIELDCREIIPELSLVEVIFVNVLDLTSSKALAEKVIKDLWGL